jgi:hypothetical protein
MGRDKSFRDGIASPATKGETQLSTFFGAVPERWKVERRPKMYTGTLIDQLMDTVERTQARTEARVDRRSLDTRSQEEKLAYWYAVAQQEVAQFDSSLAGVA